MRIEKLWQISLVIALLVGLESFAAGGQQPKTPAPPAKGPTSPASAKPATRPPSTVAAAEKVVIKVGATQVTESEVDFLIASMGPQAQQALAAQGRRPLGDQYVSALLLSQRAVADHLDLNPTVRARLELQRVQTLAQAEYEKLANQVKVTPEEIGQYFTAHQAEFDTVQVREFVVREKPAGAKDGTPGLAPEEAKTKADAIRKALTTGTDVKKVAQDFAMANVVMIDPEPRAIRHGQLLPALDQAAFDLKDGEVSQPLETGQAPNQALVFLQVVGHRRPEQKDVSREIENSLKQQRLEAQVGELRKNTDVWMDEDYFKSQAAPQSVPPAQPAAPAPTPKP